jgi:hypothetical protein
MKKTFASPEGRRKQRLQCIQSIDRQPEEGRRKWTNLGLSNLERESIVKKA